ncbi:MAG: hypothetical protein AAGI68_02420 [Planctomycetota bacterium]
MPRWLPPPRRLAVGSLVAACLGVLLAFTLGPTLHRAYRTHQLHADDPQAFDAALDYFAARRDPADHPDDFNAALDTLPGLPPTRRNPLLLVLLPVQSPLDPRLADAFIAEAQDQPLDSVLPLLDVTLSTLSSTDRLIETLTERALGMPDPQPVIQLLERHALWSLDRVGPDAYLHALKPLVSSSEPAAPGQLGRQLFASPRLLDHPDGKAFFQHLIHHPEPHARDAAISVAIAAGLSDPLPFTDPHPLLNARLQRVSASVAATAPEAHGGPSLLWAQTPGDPTSLLPTLPAAQRDRLMLHLIDTLPEAELTPLARELLLDFNPRVRFAGALLTGFAGLHPQTVTGDTAALADLLRDDPSLTAETLLTRTDDALAALGLRRTDALAHAIATTNDPQQRLRLQLGEYLRQPVDQALTYPFATAITRDPANASTYLLAALHREPADHPRFALDTLFPPIHNTTAALESWAGRSHALLTDAGWRPVLNRYLPEPLRLAQPPSEAELHRLRDTLLRHAAGGATNP